MKSPWSNCAERIRLRFKVSRGIYNAIIENRERHSVVVLMDDEKNTFRSTTNAIEDICNTLSAMVELRETVFWYQIVWDEMYLVTFEKFNGYYMFPEWTSV